MPRHLHKCMGYAKVFAVNQPYYLKNAPGNPWFGAVHDGVSTEAGAGFSVKPIQWLYRFRWNSQRRGAGPFYLRNPGGKMPHWLEVTQWNKLSPHLWNTETFPHTALSIFCSCLVIWNLTRYVFFHPDLTIYNIIYFSMRHYVNVLRNMQIPNLDTPVFRWVQQPSEFYGYNPHREMIKLGVCANDPYLEYMKAIGKADLLTKMPEEAGYNTALEYLPAHQWGWSYKEKGPLNPVPSKGGDAAHAAHH